MAQAQHNPNLAARHLRELHDQSAIALEVIAEEGFRTVTSATDLLALGFDDYQCRTPGYLLPLHGVDGSNGLFAFKPDQPRLRDGKPVKYEFQPRTKPILDIPLRCLPQLRDATVPLVLTEGKKKAACAASLGYCAVDLWGVHAWYTNPEHGGFSTIAPLPDWDHIIPTLDARLCYLAFDSDAWRNPSVALALRRLANFLAQHGALVFIVHLPDEEDGTKLGLDDLVAGYGPDAFEELLAAAEPWASRAMVHKLEQDLADLRALCSAQASVLRNQDLSAAQKITAIVTIHDASWRSSADQPAPYRVSPTRLAEAAGVAPHTVSRALEVLSGDGGIFSKTVTRNFDAETGTWTSALYLTPRASSDMLGLLNAAATYAPAQKTKQRARPTCTHHPFADVHVRSIASCTECGQVLAEHTRFLKSQKPISEIQSRRPLVRTSEDVFADSATLPALPTAHSPPEWAGPSCSKQRWALNFDGDWVCETCHP